MKLLVAALADNANVTADGKLNLHGIFDRIHALSFPAVHPLAMFAMRLMFEYEDGDSTHAISVTIENQDGREFVKLEGQVQIPKIPPGERGTANQILVLQQLRFERPEKMSVIVRWDGKERQRLPLDVVALPPQG